MSSETTGDTAEVSAEAGEKMTEGSQTPAPEAAGAAEEAKEKEKKRFQRARRDDRANEDRNPVPIQPICLRRLRISCTSFTQRWLV